MSKQHASFRLSKETIEMIRIMADNLGVSQAAIIEMSVREKALRHAKEGFIVVKGFLDKLTPEQEQRESIRKMARDRDGGMG